MDGLMTAAVHSIHWRRSEKREVYIKYLSTGGQYKHPWSVLNIGVLNINVLNIGVLNISVLNIGVLNIGVLISEYTNMAFLPPLGGWGMQASSFQGAFSLFNIPIWRSFSFRLWGSVVEGIHTSCTRGPHRGPISPRESPPGGSCPLTSDSTAQHATGAHRGAKSNIHHSGPTVRHFWDRTENVFSNPGGASAWVVIFRR